MRAEQCRHIKDARWEMLETGFRSAEHSLSGYTPPPQGLPSQVRRKRRQGTGLVARF